MHVEMLETSELGARSYVVHDGLDGDRGRPAA